MLTPVNVTVNAGPPHEWQNVSYGRYPKYECLFCGVLKKEARSPFCVKAEEAQTWAGTDQERRERAIQLRIKSERLREAGKDALVRKKERYLREE